MKNPVIHSVSRVTCHSIPEVECGHVLTPVPDVQCQPVVNRDCRPVSVEIPYIEQEKQCDEVSQCYLRNTLFLIRD